MVPKKAGLKEVLSMGRSRTWSRRVPLRTAPVMRMAPMMRTQVDVPQRVPSVLMMSTMAERRPAVRKPMLRRSARKKAKGDSSLGPG